MKRLLFIVYFFPLITFSQGWNQLANDIDGEAIYDQSGCSVSLSSDGSILAVGAFGNNGNGSNSGHVRIYSFNGSSWVQLGDDINGEASNDYSGGSVSLSADGSIVAIGASENDGNGSNSGHVRIFNFDGASWNQLGNNIEGESFDDQSGSSVSLSSDGFIVAIGASENDGNGSSSESSKEVRSLPRDFNLADSDAQFLVRQLDRSNPEEIRRVVTLQAEGFHKTNPVPFFDSFLKTSFRAEVNQNSNDMKASGNVIATSDSGITLFSESLTWLSVSEKLYTKDSIMITTIEGDTIYGIGFESDSDLKNWKIIQPSGVTGKEYK